MAHPTCGIIIIAKKNETSLHGSNPVRAFLMQKEVWKMPRKPKRPCSYPGCPRLTDGRFCEEHEKQENKRYEKYDRDPAVRRRYGRAWKRIRDSYAAAHPLCEQCLANGRYVKTEEIHHKLPLSQGGTHDRENLIALCKECHARIHASSGDRWHNR
jgi:5-methylcytosine-specific restriction protein A